VWRLKKLKDNYNDVFIHSRIDQIDQLKFWQIRVDCEEGAGAYSWPWNPQSLQLLQVASDSPQPDIGDWTGVKVEVLKQRQKINILFGYFIQLSERKLTKEIDKMRFQSDCRNNYAFF
jgi:hypothetical protein